MARSALKEIILPAALIVAGFIAIFALSGAAESQRPALPEGYDDTDLTIKGSKIRGFAFGMEGLAADYYFMRSLQYIGDKIVSSKEEVINVDDLRSLNPRLLYPLLDNSTDLDPHFTAAYSYGSVVLPAVDPEKAIALAKKGIANNPEHWRLYQHLGYIYWKLGRYVEASETYERGSEIAGATPVMKIMAAAMQSQGGSRETARSIFTEMLSGSGDPMVQTTAQRRLDELDSLDERDAIDKALTDNKAATGRCASSFADIFQLLKNIRLASGKDLRIDAQNRIVDPTDAPYILDRENCRAKVDPQRSGIPTTDN